VAETCAWVKEKKKAYSLQSIKREVTHWKKPVGKQSQVGLTPHLRLLWRQVRKSEAELGEWELVRVSAGRGSPCIDGTRLAVLGIN
jgi:hypothetical protein